MVRLRRSEAVEGKHRWRLSDVDQMVGNRMVELLEVGTGAHGNHTVGKMAVVVVVMVADLGLLGCTQEL